MQNNLAWECAAVEYELEFRYIFASQLQTLMYVMYCKNIQEYVSFYTNNKFQILGIFETDAYRIGIEI